MHLLALLLLLSNSFNTLSLHFYCAILCLILECFYCSIQERKEARYESISFKVLCLVSKIKLNIPLSARWLVIRHI